MELADLVLKSIEDAGSIGNREYKPHFRLDEAAARTYLIELNNYYADGKTEIVRRAIAGDVQEYLLGITAMEEKNHLPWFMHPIYMQTMCGLYAAGSFLAGNNFIETGKDGDFFNTVVYFIGAAIFFHMARKIKRNKKAQGSEQKRAVLQKLNAELKKIEHSEMLDVLNENKSLITAGLRNV